MNNPFKLYGQPLSQFKEEAKAWDMCIDHLKRHGVRLTENTWDGDLTYLLSLIRQQGEAGWLVFIRDDEEPEIPVSKDSVRLKIIDCLYGGLSVPELLKWLEDNLCLGGG